MSSAVTLAGPMRSALLVAVAAAAATWAAPIAAQSLGELARQEEERRKAIPTPSKIYTNESLRSQPAPAPAQPAAAAAPAVTDASQTAAQAAGPAGQQPVATEPVDPKKDQAYWKQRMQAARDALARAQTFAEALQSRINALTTDFTARHDPAQREVIATDRQKALIELDRVNLEIQQHTKAIPAIQEEARRAGVPPGWLR